MRRASEARSVRAFAARYRHDANAGRVPVDLDIEAACLARYLAGRRNGMGAMAAYASAVRTELGDHTIAFPSLAR